MNLRTRILGKRLKPSMRAALKLAEEAQDQIE